MGFGGRKKWHILFSTQKGGRGLIEIHSKGKKKYAWLGPL